MILFSAEDHRLGNTHENDLFIILIDIISSESDEDGHFSERQIIHSFLVASYLSPTNAAEFGST